jgi:sec-independent protein translocase protein TatC
MFGDKEMPFLEHLEELRWRLIKSIIALVIAATVAYSYSDQLFQFLWQPIHVAVPGLKMHFFKVTEAFNTRIKLSLVGGALLALPIILFQIWQFVLPGLYRRELRIVYIIVVFSTVFFLMGVFFCYYWMLPYGLKFLLGQAPPDTEPTIMMGDYLGFIIWTLLAFGLIFQMPVVSFFLGRIGLLTSRFLASGRRYAIVIIAIAAAVITPQPDFISQGMLGIPMYLLYELSILIVWLTGRNEPRRQKDLLG